MKISRNPSLGDLLCSVRAFGRLRWLVVMGIYFSAISSSRGSPDVFVQSTSVDYGMTISGGLYVDGVGAGNVTYDDYTWDTLWITGNLNVNGGFTVTAIETDYGWISVDSLPDFFLPGGDGSLNSLATTHGLTVGADVGMSGNLDIGGSSASLDGFSWGFVDGNNTISSNITFNGGANSAFDWRQNGVDTPADQMAFDNDGTLKISDGLSGNYLTLGPDGNVAVHQGAVDYNVSLLKHYYYFGDVAIDGVGHKIQLDTITLADASGALAISNLSGSNNIRFDASGKAVIFSSGFVINGNSTLPAFVVTVPRFAVAGDVSGANATAFGGDAQAAGLQSVAISGGNVSSSGASIAIGNLSIASANGTVALGGGNASANGAFALGGSATASGNLAMSIGIGVLTSIWGATTVGHYNVELTGSATTWNASNAAFIVGVGNSTTRTNALVLSNNGNLTVSAPTTIGDVGDTATPTRSMLVNGASVLNGAVTIAGAVTVTHAQGDISMGDYGN